MITKTAWKNIWRNRVRSLVVIAAVTIGVFGGVFAVGVMNGAIDQRIDELLDNEVSHIQLTNKEFRANNDLEYSIADVNEVIGSIEDHEEVEAVCQRLFVVGMANTARKSAGVNIIGINPEHEKKLFNLHHELMPGTGDYFSDPGREELAYIGFDLAKELNMIRYLINDDVMHELRDEEVPGEVVSKLEEFSGERFSNERSFKKEIRSVLSDKEVSEYGSIILEKAQTFRPGAKFTLTFFDSNNHQTGGVFRVGGIYNIPNSMFESSHVFVRDEILRRLIEFPGNESHMIIVRLKDTEDTRQVSKMLKTEYPGLEVLSWREIQPDIAMMSEMAEAFYGFFMVIILAALAFGILNTMLMVVLERTKELGMLTAIGMNKRKVFRMIMTESVFLSLFGGLAGMMVSWMVITITSKHGIKLFSMQEGLEAMGFSAHIYPSIGIDFFLIVTLLIILTGILSSVYPALKALKLDPAEALRTE